MAQTANSAGFFASSVDDAGVRLAQVQAKAKNELADFGEAALPAMVRILDVGEKVLDLFDRLPCPDQGRGRHPRCRGDWCRSAGRRAVGGCRRGLKLVPGLKARSMGSRPVRAQRASSPGARGGQPRSDRCHRCTVGRNRGVRSVQKPARQQRPPWRSSSQARWKGRPRRPEPGRLDRTDQLGHLRQRRRQARSPLPGSASTDRRCRQPGARVVRQVQRLSRRGSWSASRTSTASSAPSATSRDHRPDRRIASRARSSRPHPARSCSGCSTSSRPGRSPTNSTRTSSRP